MSKRVLELEESSPESRQRLLALESAVLDRRCIGDDYVVKRRVFVGLPVSGAASMVANDVFGNAEEEGLRVVDGIELAIASEAGVDLLDDVVTVAVNARLFTNRRRAAPCAATISATRDCSDADNAALRPSLTRSGPRVPCTFQTLRYQSANRAIIGESLEALAG